jgi:hypothetical protein
MGKSRGYLLAHILLFIGLVNLEVAGSTFTDTISAMQPGTWTELSTLGFTYTAACDGNTYNILNIECASSADYANQYAQHGAWDPHNGIFYFSGDAHLSGSPPAPSITNPGNVTDRSVKYDSNSNSWSTFTKPPASSHSYDHLAFNSINNKLYMRVYYTPNVYEYDPITNLWSATPLPPIPFGMGSGQVAGGMIFTPDLGSQGSLIYVDGDWGVQRFDFANFTWTTLASTNGSGEGYWMGSYHNLVEYNPTSHVILFGGGNTSYRGAAYDNRFYRLSVDQSIRAIANPPCGLGVLNGLLVPDPSSGNFLAICKDYSIFEYLTAQDIWRAAPIASPPFAGLGMDGIASVIFVAIPEQGAMLFVTYNNSGRSKVHVLKGLGTSLTAPPTPIPTPTPTPTPGSDFQARCSDSGVIRCVDFDQPADIAGTYGDNHGTLAGAAVPSLDANQKASGASSLMFTIPSNSAANSSGSYFTNFSDDLNTQFGESSDFYVQWRQRFSAEFLSTYFAGGGGWKQAILGTGDSPGCNAPTSASGLCASSCTALETVVQNTAQRGFPQMYNSCSGSNSHGPYSPFEEGYGEYDFKLQNARPAPYCLYSQGQTNPITYFSPSGNCFGYTANEWMTFQVHIQTGPRINGEFVGSYIQLWVGREGQASELVLDWGPYNLTAGTSGSEKFGKIWLLPYHTGKSSAQAHATAYTWYDDLIISRNKVAEPSGISRPPTTDTTAPSVTILTPADGGRVSKYN